MPEKDLYATKLDGQGVNESGYQSGDRGALLSWLQEHADEADVLIISLDQLLSGGLMNSRCIDKMEPVKLADGTEMTEYEVIDYLGVLAERKTLYIIDSVQRLASGTGYAGYTLRDYSITRAYGMVERPCLTGESLTVENIIQNYRLASDGTPAYLSAGLNEEDLAYLLGDWQKQESVENDEAVTLAYLQEIEYRRNSVYQARTVDSEQEWVESPDSLLNIYLSVRERKLRLSDYALRTLNTMDNVHYIMGVDDSTAGESLHVNEMQYFQQLLDEDDQMFSALDGLAQTLLAKCYMEHIQSEAINCQIIYYGDGEADVNNFNYKSNREMIDQTLGYFNCNQVDVLPDVSVLIYTGNLDQNEMSVAVAQIVSQMNENEIDMIPTILIDVSESGDALFSCLPMENIHLGMLLAYSGRTETPVQINMALAQGLSRYCSLLEPSLSETAHISHLKNLCSVMTEEVYDTSEISDEMYQFIQEQGQTDPMQDATEEQIDAIHGQLTEQLQIFSEPVMNSILSGNFIVSLAPYTLAGITQAEITDVVYPWLRVFEIRSEFQCAYSDSVNPVGEYHRWYVNGMTTTSFSPSSPLTRSQSAKLLVMLSGIEVDDATEQECELADYDEISEWARPYVVTAYNKGYIRGYSDSTFRGENNITRAECVTMVVQYMKAEGIELEPVLEAEFSDVPRNDDYYSQNIYLLADAGVINGYPDGTFKPDDNITRAEAIKIFSYFSGRGELLSEELLSIPRFTDVSEDYWAYPAIQEASITHFVPSIGDEEDSVVEES